MDYIDFALILRKLKLTHKASERKPILENMAKNKSFLGVLS